MQASPSLGQNLEHTRDSPHGILNQQRIFQLFRDKFSGIAVQTPQQQHPTLSSIHPQSTRMAPILSFSILAFAMAAVNAVALPASAGDDLHTTAVDHPLQKRDDGITCASYGDGFSDVFAQQAMALLGNACDAGGDKFVPAKIGTRAGRKSYTFNGVTAYVCNYSESPQHCQSTNNEVFDNLRDVLLKCKNAPGESCFLQLCNASFAHN